jgi:hypothetical protein
MDNFSIGDEIKVFFNLKGREWKNPEGQIKYFNTIEAWKIEKIGVTSSVPQNSSYPSLSSNNASSPAFEETKKPVFENPDSDFNDLPF